MTERATLSMWTIYSHPSDYPLNYVVRRSVVRANEVLHDREPHTLAPTLEAARESLPEGLYCLGREPNDDPVIVEVWI